MQLAVTGHRPDKLGGYSDEVNARLYRLALASLRKLKPAYVITGMVQGWDTAVALVCVDLGIPFTAAIPCDDQDRPWPLASRQRYRQLLNRSAMTYQVSDGEYMTAKMHARNRWMVDQLDQRDGDNLLALWDDTDLSGGTYRTVQYAKSRGFDPLNVWPIWVSMNAVQKVA